MIDWFPKIVIAILLVLLAMTIAELIGWDLFWSIASVFCIIICAFAIAAIQYKRRKDSERQ